MSDFDFDKTGNALAQKLKIVAVEFLQEHMAEMSTLSMASVLVGAPIQAASEAFKEFVPDGKNGPDDFMKHIEFFVNDNRDAWFEVVKGPSVN